MPLEQGEIIDMDSVNNYPTKYVAFLDLLGFRQLVKRSGADVLERRRLVEALKLVRDTLCENPSIDFRFTYFSDCFVLSADHSPNALWQVFQSIELLTCNLLQYDILVRGGLAVGPAHHSKDFLYGEAVIEAYDLERLKEKAKSPLVLLSPEVVQEVESLGPEFKQWIREDGADRFFIHYLMRYAEYSTSMEVGKVVLTYPAQRIAYFIGTRLKNDQDDVLRKAEWFQRYWNDSVAARGVLPRIELNSQSTLPANSLTIIKRRLIAPVVSRTST
jgi:hypothetical protein